MDNKEKSKEAFSSFLKKTSDLGKKAAEGAKNLAEQTKKSIHDQQAKKYTPVTAKEYKSKSFVTPSIIEIVDDSANRDFICDDAIGWIEKHEDVDVLHMYSNFVKKSGLSFVPVPQCDNVYCADNFEKNKFINANSVFGKATEEKLAELEHIANFLGAKSCSVEIVEAASAATSKELHIKSSVNTDSSLSLTNKNMQSGKTVSLFEGCSTPRKPTLKWFAHDDNILRLIDMRCSENNSITAKKLELKGSSSATMSKKIACAIDDILRVRGSFSMEKMTVKEHSNILVYEVQF